MDTKSDQKSRLNQLSTLSRAEEIAEMQPLQHSGGVATIDMIPAQIVPVKRDLQSIMRNIKILAEAAGEDYYYSFPAKEKVTDPETGRETWVETAIEGPSIKLANDLAREYGNCGVRTRVEDNEKNWTFYALFYDLERGYTLERPFQQRKDQKTMGKGGRAQDIAFQIGASKAIRNVVTNALETFSNFMLETAKQSLAENVGRRLDYYRQKCLDRLKELAIDVRRVELIVGRKAVDWRVPEVVKLIAQIKAIGDGMANVSDIFPPLDQYEDQPRQDDETAKGSEPAGATTGNAGGNVQSTVSTETAKPIADANAIADAEGDGKPAASTQQQTVEADGGKPGASGDAGGAASGAERSGGAASAGEPQTTATATTTDDVEDLSPQLLSLLKDLSECGSSSRATLLEREAKENLSANEHEVFKRSYDRRVAQFAARKAQGGKRQ
jgi:hypothetical protein